MLKRSDTLHLKAGCFASEGKLSKNFAVPLIAKDILVFDSFATSDDDAVNRQGA